MIFRSLLLCALGAALVGCAANATQPEDLAGRGYIYHDANHPNPRSYSNPNARPSGIWLWPPASDDRPG